MEDENKGFDEKKKEAKKEIKEEVKKDVLGEIKKPTPTETIPKPENKPQKPTPEIFKKPEIKPKKPRMDPFKPKPAKSFNWWMLGAIVFFILFAASMFTNGFSSITGMTAATAGDKAINFLNEDLLPPGTEANLINAEAQSGVYQLKLNIDGEEYDSYVTKDGELFFISGIDLTESKEISEEDNAEQQTGFDAPDQETPTIDLFVMSFCPYGQQAINNIAPAIDLLSKEIQFTPHYIVNMDNGIVNSLHGSKEADEDMRQACIWKYYTENYWDYVLYVNQNIPLNNINEKWTEAAEEAGLDIESIKTCVEEEGVELMKAENELTSELGVSGSPTLIINGERYSGDRTPEAFKQAICSGFEEQPEVCSETLEGGVAADGNC